MFDFLYKTDDDDKIDEAYKAPEIIGKDWVEVANFKGEGDGQNVKVYECRYPARFYKLIAFDTPNSVGDINKGFSMSTGSGRKVGKLIFAMARAISEGMLGLSEDDE